MCSRAGAGAATTAANDAGAGASTATGEYFGAAGLGAAARGDLPSFRPPRALPPRPRPAAAAGPRRLPSRCAGTASGVTVAGAGAAAAGWSTISDGRRRSCFDFRWRRCFSALLASLTAAWAAARSAACGSSMIESDDDRVSAVISRYFDGACPASRDFWPAASIGLGPNS